MKKLGGIFHNVIPVNNYYGLSDDKCHEYDNKNDSESINKWRSKKIQDKLKIAMEKARPKMGAENIEYPNYKSWIEAPQLKLLYFVKSMAFFQVNSRFCAERGVRDFSYVLLSSLRDVNPRINALKIMSPEDEMFRSDREVTYEKL